MGRYDPNWIIVLFVIYLDAFRVEKNWRNQMTGSFSQCSTGMRPPGWGSWGTRPSRPWDGGTPGGMFPHVPFLGRHGGAWGDAIP
jgi:hypothetical protein